MIVASVVCWIMAWLLGKYNFCFVTYFISLLNNLYLKMYSNSRVAVFTNSEWPFSHAYLKVSLHTQRGVATGVLADQLTLFKLGGAGDYALYSNLTGAPVALKTWCGHQSRVDRICPPLVEIGLRWLPKIGVDTSPRPHAHRRAWFSTYLSTN